MFNFVFFVLDSTHEIKLISHTYVNITDENLCARNLRIVGLVQKVRNFDASKISTFTVYENVMLSTTISALLSVYIADIQYNYIIIHA